MTIKVSVPDKLTERAAAQGLSVEALVEHLAEQAAHREAEPKWVRFGPGPLTPEQAVDDLREARKGITLGGLSLKDLCGISPSFPFWSITTEVSMECPSRFSRMEDSLGATMDEISLPTDDIKERNGLAM